MMYSGCGEPGPPMGGMSPMYNHCGGMIPPMYSPCGGGQPYPMQPGPQNCKGGGKRGGGGGGCQNNRNSVGALQNPSKRYEGRIKSFNAAQGFGFIESMEASTLFGRDVFL